MKNGRKKVVIAPVITTPLPPPLEIAPALLLERISSWGTAVPNILTKGGEEAIKFHRSCM